MSRPFRRPMTVVSAVVCIMHTDRGSEYTSDEFRTEIRRLRMRQSMGRADSCYGNAAAESWFAVLKAEIGTTVRETLEAARPTSSATSRSSTTAADSADTPSMGTSPHSKREPCSGKGPGGTSRRWPRRWRAQHRARRVSALRGGGGASRGPGGGEGPATRRWPCCGGRRSRSMSSASTGRARSLPQHDPPPTSPAWCRSSRSPPRPGAGRTWWGDGEPGTYRSSAVHARRSVTVRELWS